IGMAERHSSLIPLACCRQIDRHAAAQLVELTEMGHGRRKIEISCLAIPGVGSCQILRNAPALLVEHAELVHRGSTAERRRLLVPGFGGRQINVPTAAVLAPLTQLIGRLSIAALGGFPVPRECRRLVLRDAEAKLEQQAELYHAAGV